MEPFTVAGLSTVLARMLPEPHAGLLAGILFGTRAALSRQLTDAFIATGTIHIIALSGQNVSIVSAVFAAFLLPFVSRRIASLLTLLALAGYLGLVGPSPSLVRAVIMGSLSLVAVIFGKRNLSLLSLVLAVTTMLLLNPSWTGDLGFQLSVAATLGIILFGRQTRNALVNQLRITLSAQLFTTPIILIHFRRLSLVAPLANFLIGWSMPYLMLFGWLAALAGALVLPLGLPPAWISWALLTYVISAVDGMAKLPLASVSW